MNYLDVYKNGIAQLKKVHNENAVFEVRCIFEKCFDMNRAQLAVEEAVEAPADKCRLFEEWIARRAQHEPLQYILGVWAFMGLEFDVGKGVLIPRPETELLAEAALAGIGESPKIIFDLCAGSGCIGLALAFYCKACEVYLVEKSDDALAFLQSNAKKHGLSNSHIVKGDISAGFEGFLLPKPDIIVSNPPYIRTDELVSLQSEVQHEPAMALDGGRDGLDFYRILAEKWMSHMNEGGEILVECGEGQHRAIEKIFAAYSKNITKIEDFNGNMRIITAGN